MTKQQHTDTPSSKQPSKSLDKGREQRALTERQGREVDGEPTHPEERETGHKGASNVGEDETSGSE
jgi:hypothetical protein